MPTRPSFGNLDNTTLVNKIECAQLANGGL